MKKLLLSAVAATAVVAIAPAMSQTADSAPTAVPAKPKAMKTVTRAEVAQRVQKHFTRLDTNRDGFVIKAEADAAAATIRERIGNRMEKRGSAMFDRFDTNKDGVVTRAEAEPFFARRQVDIAHAGPGEGPERRNWDALITRFDANRDGTISRAEFDAGHSALRQRIGDRAGKAGRHHAGFGGHMFEMADSNKDGRVSLAEATVAATAHFDAADINRDGQLTADERRQARQKMRTNAPRN